jgi:hypothetical protein
MSETASEILGPSRPRDIEVGIRFLYASLLLAFIACIVRDFHKYIDLRSAVGAIGSDAFTLGFMLFFVLKISSGRNWARIAFLIVFLLGMILMVGLSLSSFGLAQLRAEGLLMNIFATVQTLVQGLALAFLFKPEANAWFKSRREFV